MRGKINVLLQAHWRGMIKEARTIIIQLHIKEARTVIIQLHIINMDIKITSY